MPYVADLLGRGSPIPFALLAGPAAETELTSVAAVESLRSLEHVPPGALAVVTGRSTARAVSCRSTSPSAPPPSAASRPSC